MFSANWTIADLIRTALDRSVLPGGFLAVQDDIGPLVGDELPFDRLVRRAAEHRIAVHDFRQRERTGRGRAHGTRNLGQISALWLHQTAALISDPEQCLGIPAHSTIVLGGDIVLLHPLAAYLYHGHHANRFSIGIEVACRAAGIMGDPRTFWRSRKEISAGRTYEQLVREASDRQLVALDLLSDYYVGETDRQVVTDVGAGLAPQIIDEIGLHRGSHRSRVSDPGERLALAAKRIAERHGLAYGATVVGSGKRTPTRWGGAPGVPYNWRVRGY